MNSEDHYSSSVSTYVEPGSKSRARQIIKGLTEYSRKISQSISKEIKSESHSIAVAQLDLTSRKLDVLAEGLREAAGKLREKHGYSLANVMEMGSESVMRLSNSLRVTTPEEILKEVEGFARNRPVIFLGSTVVAGILLGQLFSSAGEGAADSSGEAAIEYKPGDNEEEYYGPH
jgi:hypothetical protein